jgi:uncharacterized membrane protein YbaN (DUF454 family)
MPRMLWLWIGHFFLGLGFIGLFLPILPTTPFILLASACYSRGSAKFETWLIEHKLFGPALRDWRSQKVIRPRAKIFATLSIAASVAFVVFSPKIPAYGKIGMVSLVVPVWMYLVTRQSKPRDKMISFQDKTDRP